MRLTPEYTKYIQSAKWKLKCDMYWAAQGRWCRGCLARTGPLEVHHKMGYSNLGNESLSELAGLCHRCHIEVHSLHWKMGKRTPYIVVYNTFIQKKRLERLKGKRR